MGFVAISIDNYVIQHLDNNPSENEKDLRKRLNSALEDYKNGGKCSCGNDIWVVGSASVGNTKVSPAAWTTNWPAPSGFPWFG